MEHKDNLEKIVDEENGDGGWVDTHHYADSTVTEVREHAGQIDPAGGKQNQVTVEDDDDDDDDDAADMEEFERTGMMHTDPLEAPGKWRVQRIQRIDGARILPSHYQGFC